MATIKDVAREAGLAVGTVSRVLNNRGYISDNAREKVNEAVKKLNYQPNEMARSLQKKRSNLIGVIVPHIAHPYFSSLISNIEEAAWKKDYRILLLNSKGIPTREVEFMDLCSRNQVVGIILCSGNMDIRTQYIENNLSTSTLNSGEVPTPNSSEVPTSNFGEESKSLSNRPPISLIEERLQEGSISTIPIVTIERKLQGGDAAIECDNEEGGRLAANHLIDRGCRHPLHISGIACTNMPAEKREQGFVAACRERGVEPRVVKFTFKEYRLQQAEENLKHLLKENPETDGIFASDDILAVELLRACLKSRIPVPDRMKIVGFDGTDITIFSPVSITTIRQPIKEMAERAVSYISQMVDHKQVPVRTILPVELLVRETT